MSSRSNRAVVIAGLLVLATGALAQSGTGTRWEMHMQIPGMEEAMKGVEMPPGMEGMAMPGMSPGGMTQKMCLPKDPKEPPPPQEQCKVLEQHSTQTAIS